MKSLLVSVVVSALGMTVGLTTACAPAVDLKQPAEFSQSRISRMRTKDTCRLAASWKALPRARAEAITQRTVGHKSNWLEFGRATVRLGRGPVLQKLQEILRRFYRGVPGPLLRSPMVLELEFIRRVGEPRVRLGNAPVRPLGKPVAREDHDILVRVGGATFRLAYHPCVGELLLGTPPQPRERSTLSERLHRVL